MKQDVGGAKTERTWDKGSMVVVAAEGDGLARVTSGEAAASLEGGRVCLVLGIGFCVDEAETEEGRYSASKYSRQDRVSRITLRKKRSDWFGFEAAPKDSTLVWRSAAQTNR